MEIDRKFIRLFLGFNLAPPILHTLRVIGLYNKPIAIEPHKGFMDFMEQFSVPCKKTEQYSSVSWTWKIDGTSIVMAVWESQSILQFRHEAGKYRKMYCRRQDQAKTELDVLRFQMYITNRVYKNKTSYLHDLRSFLRSNLWENSSHFEGSWKLGQIKINLAAWDDYTQIQYFWNSKSSQDMIRTTDDFIQVKERILNFTRAASYNLY